MSVTFSAGIGEITGFAYTCGHDNGLTAHRFGTFDSAQRFLQVELDAHGCTGHLAVCGDEYCADSRMSVMALEANPSPELNVSNTNARHLLDLLGYSAEDSVFGGSDTAENFLGRVLMATAVNPADAGVPATSSRSGGGALLIDCGRRPGYSEDRLAQLREVADFAVAHNRAVQWC